MILKPAHLRHQSTADNLGNQTYNHKAYGKQKDFTGHTADIGLQTDAGKKYGTEQHIGVDIHLLRNITGVLNGAKDNTCHVSTCNIRNTEEYLCYISENKTERQT